MVKYILSALFVAVGIAIAYAACVSPDGTTIPPAAEIFAPDGGTWTLNSSNEVLRNNTDTFLAAPELEINNNGLIYAKDASGNWHIYEGWQPSGDPTAYAVPQTITAAFLSANFHSTFSDTFASGLPTICLNGTYSATCNWYNATEQCCMSPTPQPGNVGGAMFPTAVGANGPYNPYSNTSSSGGLTMTMHTETTTDATHTFTSVFSGVTTSIASNGQGFKQQFGYFEATMQVSPNVGTWPAFWMLSPSKNMEIDVVEQYGGNGHNPNNYFATSHDYASGALYGPNEFGTGTSGPTLSSGFHQFGVLIDAGHLSFYLDRNLMGSTTTPPDAKQPMYLLFDQGSGGGWPTCAGPSQVGVSPPPAGTSCSQGAAQLEGAQLLIQSINVWQHN